MLTHLVGVLHKDVLALGVLHAHVRDGADNTPAVRKRDIELRREVGRPR